ncbi:hypothetical protein C8R44DRAFT_974429 [Mycena epipterygia]|nr:hypothetical protein C8R44DRAFT_974429 [Mycena epipterygia]
MHIRDVVQVRDSVPDSIPFATPVGLFVTSQTTSRSDPGMTSAQIAVIVLGALAIVIIPVIAILGMTDRRRQNLRIRVEQMNSTKLYEASTASSFALIDPEIGLRSEHSVPATPFVGNNSGSTSEIEVVPRSGGTVPGLGDRNGNPFRTTALPNSEANVSDTSDSVRTSNGNASQRGGIETSEPNASGDSGLRNSNGTLRQQYLENELRAAHQKLVDIEELERSTVAAVAATQITGPRRVLRLLSTRSTSTVGSNRSQDLVSQLEAAKERNEMMAARIQELEAQMHSEWALGLSDEPPPGYTIYSN